MSPTPEGSTLCQIVTGCKCKGRLLKFVNYVRLRIQVYREYILPVTWSLHESSRRHYVENCHCPRSDAKLVCTSPIGPLQPFSAFSSLVTPSIAFTDSDHRLTPEHISCPNRVGALMRRCQPPSPVTLTPVSPLLPSCTPVDRPADASSSKSYTRTLPRRRAPGASDNEKN